MQLYHTRRYAAVVSFAMAGKKIHETKITHKITHEETFSEFFFFIFLYIKLRGGGGEFVNVCTCSMGGFLVV